MGRKHRKKGEPKKDTLRTEVFLGIRKAGKKKEKGGIRKNSNVPEGKKGPRSISVQPQKNHKKKKKSQMVRKEIEKSYAGGPYVKSMKLRREAGQRHTLMEVPKVGAHRQRERRGTATVVRTRPEIQSWKKRNLRGRKQGKKLDAASMEKEKQDT